MDFSQQALEAMYLYESEGGQRPAADNGYAQGKKMMGVTVSMWREDLWVTLHPQELYEDPDLPGWWLDKVLGISRA